MTLSFTNHFRFNLPDFNSEPWHEYLQDNFAKIDDVLYRTLAQQGIVTWENGTQYGPGEIAFDDASDTFWFCTTTHTSAAAGTFEADRAANPTYWTAVALGLAARGEWTNDTSYQYYDLVYDTDLGIVGLCTTPHISSSAPNTIEDDEANWAFIVDIANLLNASALAFTPVGDISSTNVQDALGEVDGDLSDIFDELLSISTELDNLLYTNFASSAIATGADLAANTASKIMDVASVWDAADPEDLGNKNGSVTLNCASRLNFKMTLNGNITIANPSNLKNGQVVNVYWVQDATGGRTVAFGNQFFPVGGTSLTFNATANAPNFISMVRMDSGHIVVSGGRLV